MIKKILLPILIACILLEALLAGALYFIQRGLAEQVSPSYHWSTYTSYGQKLGSQSGRLKLELRPFITYGNVPHQELPFLTINSKGYRGDELRNRNPDIQRIVVVGGSAAFGTGLNSNRETFSQQFADITGAEVVNAAVIGHQSGQELAYVTSELIELQPDLIVAYDGWNDFMQTSWQGSIAQVGDVSFYQIERQLGILSTITDPNPIWRLIYGVPRVLFPTLVRGVQTAMQSTEAKMFTKEATELTARLYIKNIEKMQAFAHSYDARVLVVLQADKRVVLQESGKSFEGEKANSIATQYRYFCELAQAHFVEAKIPVLNLHEFSEKLPAKLFMDNVHLNAEGNGEVAKIVDKVLSERPALKAHKSSFVNHFGVGESK